MAIDEARLEEFINRFAGDFGAALHASTVVVGDKLGLYRALADLGPTDAATLADATGCDARLVQEWLDAQYVSGYCHFSAQTGHVLAEPRTGRRPRRPDQPGVPRRQHDDRGVDRQGRGEDPRGIPDRQGSGLARAPPRPVPRDRAAVQAGLRRQPRLDSGSPRSTASPRSCTRGGSVADLGCGHGASTILLAQAYPQPTITGFDYHQASIDIARKRAAEAGVADRVRFEVAVRAGLPRHAATTSSASSTRCTTWAIRPARHATSARRSRRTARGCSSNRWPASASTTT